VAADVERPELRPPGLRHTILLCLAYDGAPWAGFVAQKNAATVGGALLTALRRLDPQVDKLRVASRTDAGVHARAQRVAFDTDRDFPTRAWVLGVGQRLPPSIAVRWAARARAGYNPRFETRSKRYRYLVLIDRVADPFHEGRAWRVYGIDGEDRLRLLRAELSQALGKHDFGAFASARDLREHRTRTLTSVSVERVGDRLVALDIRGDGFLHNMVRILVGTAVDVALGRLAPGAVTRALSSRERRDAGVTAPASGLYLEEVELSDDGEDRWPPP
jgi:tRNA pseudouridine38-40 synthase